MFLYFLFSLIYYLIFLYFFLAVHLLLFLVLFSLLLHSLYFLYLLDRIGRLPLVICFSNIHHNLSDWYIFLNEINLIQILLYLSIQLPPWYMMLHLPLWKYFLFHLSYMCNLCNMLHLPIIFDYLYIALKMWIYLLILFLLVVLHLFYLALLKFFFLYIWLLFLISYNLFYFFLLYGLHLLECKCILPWFYLLLFVLQFPYPTRFFLHFSLLLLHLFQVLVLPFSLICYMIGHLLFRLLLILLFYLFFRLCLFPVLHLLNKHILLFLYLDNIFFQIWLFHFLLLNFFLEILLAHIVFSFCYLQILFHLIVLLFLKIILFLKHL